MKVLLLLLLLTGQANALKIEKGKVTTSVLSDGAVTTTKIVDGAVTTNKIDLDAFFPIFLNRASKLVGINTSNPGGILDVVADGSKYALVVSSQNGNPRFRYDAELGHLDIAGTDPALGTCTNGTIHSNSSDTAGIVNFTGANSTCAIVWAEPFNAVPMCLCTGFNAGNSGCEIIAQTASGVTFGPEAGNWASGDAINYMCWDLNPE